MAIIEDRNFNKEFLKDAIDINFEEIINIYIQSIEKKIIISQKNYMKLIEISLK